MSFSENCYEVFYDAKEVSAKLAVDLVQEKGPGASSPDQGRRIHEKPWRLGPAKPRPRSFSRLRLTSTQKGIFVHRKVPQFGNVVVGVNVDLESHHLGSFTPPNFFSSKQ